VRGGHFRRDWSKLPRELCSCQRGAGWLDGDVREGSGLQRDIRILLSSRLMSSEQLAACSLLQLVLEHWPSRHESTSRSAAGGDAERGGFAWGISLPASGVIPSKILIALCWNWLSKPRSSKALIEPITARSYCNGA
jgi:hypothetical protein